jgi:hypothetical protein
VLVACRPADIGRHGASVIDRGGITVRADPGAQVNDATVGIDGCAHAPLACIQRTCHLAGIVDVRRVEVGRQLVNGVHRFRMALCWREQCNQAGQAR